MTTTSLPRVAILHPELGVGGAERFALDAARALASRGHDVRLYVARIPDDLAFSDARSGAVRPLAVADWLPHTLFGHFQAPLGIAALCAAGAAARGTSPPPDVLLVDVTSAAIPFLRAMGFRRIVFYGHFPDQRLARHDGWRSTYRRPLDWLEERGLLAAQRILVNSHFTLGAFNTCFPSVHVDARNVLHPAIVEGPLLGAPALSPDPSAPFEVLALSRFAPQKGHALVLEAFLALWSRTPSTQRQRMRLTLAGAVDDRQRDQRRVVETLRQRIESSDVAHAVALELHVDEDRKRKLFERATVLVYAPIDEHFGLVPLEAMASARPVIAMNTGGPRETVSDGSTGRLVAPDATAIRDALEDLQIDRARARAWGLAGRAAVSERFSFESFSEKLHHHVCEASAGRDPA